MGLRREPYAPCRACFARSLLIPFAFWLVSASPAFGLSLEVFECLTNSSAIDCAIGVSQLSGEVEAAGLGEATLTLFNSGPDEAVVARVYIESEWVAAISAVPSEDVSFSAGGAPPVLPGGGKTFDVGVFASALPPPPQTGIGPGETGLFNLMLDEGVSFEDLVSDLRIGVHVIAFESGGSESLVSHPIPEPSTGGLALLALGVVIVGRRAVGRTPPGAA